MYSSSVLVVGGGEGGRRRGLKDIFDSRWRLACSPPLLPEKDAGFREEEKV
jgi:hypothetical protein